METAVAYITQLWVNYNDSSYQKSYYSGDLKAETTTGIKFEVNAKSSSFDQCIVLLKTKLEDFCNMHDITLVESKPKQQEEELPF